MSNVYTFSLESVYIAANNGDGTFGTAYQLESSKDIRIAEKLISDRAEGNSQITALASQRIGHELSLGTAGFDDEVFDIIYGTAAVASNGGEYLDEGNDLYPYFGMIAQAYPDEGDVLLFWPYCKITGDTTYALEFGKIVVPSFKVEAIKRSPFAYIMRKLTRPDGGAITFPPTIPA